MILRSLLLRVAALGVIVACAFPLFAQYTDSAAVNDLGGPQEFARRRSELAKQLKSGYLILFARKTLPEAVHYREDNDFFYYTGLSDPGAANQAGVWRESSFSLRRRTQEARVRNRAPPRRPRSRPGIRPPAQ